MEVDVDIDDEDGLLLDAEGIGAGVCLDEVGVMLDEEDVLRNSGGGAWKSARSN